MSAKELDDIIETMREKEIRLRVELAEIIPEDKGGSAPSGGASAMETGDTLQEKESKRKMSISGSDSGEE